MEINYWSWIEVLEKHLTATTSLVNTMGEKFVRFLHCIEIVFREEF